MCGGVGGDGGGEGEREGKKKRGTLVFPDSREAGMPPAPPSPHSDWGGAPSLGFGEEGDVGLFRWAGGLSTWQQLP